jgi:hypothetical protein
MFAHVPRDHARVSVEATARRETNDEPDGFPLVEVFLRESRRNLRHETENKAYGQQQTANTPKHIASHDQLLDRTAER